ncbi:MAG: lamin tail domain-containing protein [Ignavibacteriales bacterium]|nr:lamin tail domain-containing protein [Ignavibacteriales bacterium]
MTQPAYVERFDSTSVPLLPIGWSTTTNRLSSGDFVTTTSSPRSSPNAVLSTNATISQSLTSPPLNFAGTTPVRLEFYASRSSSHAAGLIVDVSIDNGITFPMTLTDTLRNPGTSAYVLSSIPLPVALANQRSVRFRWRLIAVPSGGATGTFRLDDVAVITIPSFDLGLTRLQALPEAGDSSFVPGQKITLGAAVKNSGTQNATEYEIHFFQDTNSDGKAELPEEFADVKGSNLLSSDSTLITATSNALIAGDNRFIAVVSWLLDTNPWNDTAFVDVIVGAEPRSIIINEIMFDPLSGQNEWVEFYHRGQDPIDIARWRFSDRPTSSGANAFVIATMSTLIQPRDFIVVAADSSLFSQFPSPATATPTVHCFILSRSNGFGLNNDGDDVILRDALGKTIDSVSYSSLWHHPDVTITKGRSLERISPEIASNDKRNWSTSPSSRGGTPGQPNGIFTTSLPSAASLSISPNPFSPDGDGFEDFCIIRYNLPLTTSLIRISIFDIRGRLLRTLANTELSGPKGEIVWDGLDDAKQRVRIGPYVVFIEAIDGQAGILATAKAVVVVATKL